MILLIHYQRFFLLSIKAIINNFLRRSLDGATFPWWCPKAELLYVSSCPHEEWFNKVIISKSTVYASICWLVRFKNEIGFSTVVTNYTSFAGFCWGHYISCCMLVIHWEWPWSNVFKPFFNLLQKTVQLEDQLQRYNACFWRWKGEIEQNIYERKDKWKQKKCPFRLFGCKGSCGKRWPLPPRWLGHIPDQYGPWTILPQEGRRELVLSGKGVQERVEKDGLDLKIFSLKPLNFLEVWQLIGYF